MDFKVNVEILFSEDGAREAASRRTVTIIIDAMRASVTTTTALKLGATGVIPVPTIEEAKKYLGRPNHRVAGERQGAKSPGFDHGNSPSELMREQEKLAGQTLVLSTSNGTRMVDAARDGSAAVFMGSTVNAAAVARAAFELARALERDIVLIAAGEYGDHAEEDDCGARAIARHLHGLGAVCDPEIIREEAPLPIFDATPSAAELRQLGYEQDISFCAQLNVFDIAPILQGDTFVAFSEAENPVESALSTLERS